MDDYKLYIDAKAVIPQVATSPDELDDQLLKEVKRKAGKYDFIRDGKEYLIISTDASHTGYVNDNYRMYMKDTVSTKDYRTWFEPQLRPFLLHHGESLTQQDPIGRILHAEWVENKSNKRKYGDGTVRTGALISDKDAIEKILDGIYHTVSTGFRAGSSKCSICGRDVGRYGCDEHEQGKEYDGKVAYLMQYDLTYIEESFVNNPAHIHAAVKNKYRIGVDSVSAEDIDVNDILLTYDKNVSFNGLPQVRLYIFPKGNVYSMGTNGKDDKNMGSTLYDFDGSPLYKNNMEDDMADLEQVFADSRFKNMIESTISSVLEKQLVAVKKDSSNKPDNTNEPDITGDIKILQDMVEKLKNINISQERKLSLLEDANKRLAEEKVEADKVNTINTLKLVVLMSDEFKINEALEELKDKNELEDLQSLLNKYTDGKSINDFIDGKIKAFDDEHKTDKELSGEVENDKGKEDKSGVADSDQISDSSKILFSK